MLCTASNKTNKTLSVKIPANIVVSLRLISAATGETIQDLLEDLLKDRVTEMEARVLSLRSHGMGTKQDE